MSDSQFTPLARCILSALHAIDAVALGVASTDESFDIIADVIEMNLSLSQTTEIKKIAEAYFCDEQDVFGNICVLSYFASGHNHSDKLNAILDIENLPLNSEFEGCEAIDIGKRIYDCVDSDIKQAIDRFFKVKVDHLIGNIKIHQTMCVSASKDVNNLHVRLAATSLDGITGNSHKQCGFVAELGKLYIPISFKEITLQDFKVATTVFDIEHYPEEDIQPSESDQVMSYLAVH